VTSDHTAAVAGAAKCRRSTDAALQELDRVVFALHPDQLRDAGLVPSLRRLVAGLAARAEVRIVVLGAPQRLRASVEVALFRIVQEALSNALAHGHARSGVAADPRIAAHARRMAWHAVGYQGGVAFPGDSLFRLSMDLATGTAGVLLAMAAALAPQGGTLPFHAPAARPFRGPSARPFRGPSGRPAAHGLAHPAHVAPGDVAGVHLTDVPGGNGQGWGTKPRIARRQGQ